MKKAKQVRDQISPLKSKVQDLMVQCEDENLVEIRNKFEDLDGVKNIEQLNKVYTEIADPYKPENMKMGMQTVREFLNGDEKVRSEIFRRKDQIEKEYKRREYYRRKMMKKIQEQQEELLEQQRALSRSANTPRSNILSELTPLENQNQHTVIDKRNFSERFLKFKNKHFKTESTHLETLESNRTNPERVVVPRDLQVRQQPEDIGYKNHKQLKKGELLPLVQTKSYGISDNLNRTQPSPRIVNLGKNISPRHINNPVPPVAFSGALQRGNDESSPRRKSQLLRPVN